MGSAALVEFEDGAQISYDPVSHALEMLLPAGGTAAIPMTGGLTINGDGLVNGMVEASIDVKAGSISLKDHKHGGVRAGGTKTKAPEPTLHPQPSAHSRFC